MIGHDDNARVAIEARRPFRLGGDTCTILVRRGRPGTVEILPHAADQWAIELDDATCSALLAALTDLRPPRRSDPSTAGRGEPR